MMLGPSRTSRIAVTTVLATFVAWPQLLGGGEPADRKHVLEFDVERGAWTEQAPPIPGTPDGDLRLARALYSDGQHSKAAGAVKDWIKTYGELHELYPQAALLQCDVLIARSDYYKAHVRLQEFLNEFAATQYEDAALMKEFVIAERFLGGTKRKLLGLPILKADDIGLSILDEIAANHPETLIAEQATWHKAEYYFNKTGDFAFAEQEYGLLVQNFPRSRRVRPALLRSAQAALASFPGIEFDDAPLVEAEERFRRYLQQYPGFAEQEQVGVLLQNIGGQRAEKELSIGRYYERTDHLQAARFYYRSTIEHWPGTIAALRAAERLESLEGVAGKEPSRPATPAGELQQAPEEDDDGGTRLRSDLLEEDSDK